MDCFHSYFFYNFINFLFILQVSIITSGYDTIQRTQLVIHIYTKKLTFVCKDGRVLHFSHEPQELRDFILCQISQHQVRIRVRSRSEFQIWNLELPLILIKYLWTSTFVHISHSLKFHFLPFLPIVNDCFWADRISPLLFNTYFYHLRTWYVYVYWEPKVVLQI